MSFENFMMRKFYDKEDKTHSVVFLTVIKKNKDVNTLTSLNLFSPKSLILFKNFVYQFFRLRTNSILLAQPREPMNFMINITVLPF